MVHYSARQGDTLAQDLSASVAHWSFLSLWQLVQAFGILYCSVMAGVMNANVWLRTLTSAMVASIFGMWQFTQSEPALPA